MDRLTFNGAIIETGTASYRLARTRNQQPALNGKPPPNRGPSSPVPPA
jgi:hypothetical protein